MVWLWEIGLLVCGTVSSCDYGKIEYFLSKHHSC